MSVQDPHPALQTILEGPRPSTLGSDLDDWMTTSPSLAQALAVGCLAGLDQSLTKIDIWDPAVGSGYAGGMLADALTAAGINVRYRGQDINERAVVAARDRLASVPDAEVVQADTLGEDRFANFNADLVIVDAPWGLNWQTSGAAVHARRDRGEFRFGLPQGSDSTWLFISLALEKIRPASQGGGRVAALVAPSTLSSGGSTEELRRAIMVAGLIESVTRLPEGLAPNTGIPLYLLTFTNATGRVARDTAMIADLRAQFTTDKGRRSILRSAFDELESGLRRWKPGPRSRVIRTSQFIRRDATLGRITSEGRKLSWRLTSFNDTPVDSDLLESRYGPESGIAVDGSPRETVDLDPSHHFSDDAGDILKSLAAAGWSARRLTTLLASEPTQSDGTEESNASIFVPTTRVGVVSTASAGTNSEGRVLRVPLDEVSIDTGFLAAWLNSELGESSRRRAIDAGSTGALVRALRSDAGSLMRWADEMIVPVPPHEVQTSVVTADERLASFQSELDRRRASIWTAPDTADAVVDSVAGAFDDSLSLWIEQLPYPIATALWTAETAASLGDKQLAYIHAWEAIVAFHATILLSACRSIPGTGDEMQASIRRALDAHGLTIERATFGTWVLIAEKASSVVRQALYSNDRDELARVRAAFGDLGQASIARLASKDLIKKFNEANSKRNKWNGHSGYTSDDERQDQIESLVADLRELRQILGDVWSQLTLVRAGGLERGRDGYVQTAEVALGAKSPFRRNAYRVGDPMVAGDLYLVKDGSERPLHLLQFVQLRSSSRDTRCTTYFYNRIEGSSVRLVSYQSGSESELMENVASFVDDFGQLVGP